MVRTNQNHVEKKGKPQMDGETCSTSKILEYHCERNYNMQAFSVLGIFLVIQTAAGIPDGSNSGCNSENLYVYRVSLWNRSVGFRKGPIQ